MQRIFQSFVDSLIEGIDVATLHATLADAAAAFGFPLFAYFSVPAGTKAPAWLISNYSAEWTDRYLHWRFDRRDPVILRASARPEPFVWGEGVLSKRDAAEQQMFFEEASGFGIRWGYTVPVHDRGGLGGIAAVTFAGGQAVPSFVRASELQGRLLQLMAIYFHRHARRLLGGTRVVHGVILTRREIECLEWSARGKSARDIGQLLGISRRTAAFHLDNARMKLDVRTIQQAIALLAESKALHRPEA
jgi:DNA-binding CsgD family transcriptional regulator